ncbi:MAG: hypothetical protein DRQ88_13225 [Epsilonproteobacteria bacterium]|nr:MAG: hypothetical protein DRQ88_13225 [Campylobacterota bacterium]
MSANLIIVLLLFVLSGVSGFFFGKTRALDKNIQLKEKISEFKDKNETVNFRKISSLAKPNIKKSKKSKREFKKNASYLQEYLSEDDNKELYNKTLRKFSEAHNKENMALWITLGTSFTNSKEYTTLYENSLKKLNENPDQTLNDINSQINDLTDKDDFLRGMLNNLVHNLDVEDDKKVEFFGKELNRSITLDKNGGIKDGSTSIINSMILMKQYVVDSQTIRTYLEESLNQNKIEKNKEALRFRYLQYFPDLKNEI